MIVSKNQEEGLSSVNWFSTFILQRAKFVAILGTLLAIVGGYYSVELYKNLKTDIHELLPTSARSVIDLKKVSGRLRSIDNLAILVFSSNTVASKKFVIDLAQSLEKLPTSVSAGVEYRIDRELKFFRDRQALYLDLQDLIKIRDYVRDKINYETELHNPLNIFSEVSLPEPDLDFQAMRLKYTKDLSGFDHLPNGFYANHDETRRLILIKLPGEATGIHGATQLKEAAKKTIESLNPKSYSPDLEVRYSGDVETLIEEQTALVEDLEISTIIVTLVVGLGMLLFYRTLRATFALMMSLIVGTLWTFGISYFAVGYLNANSAFLGSIIIGNGINFGIIYLARYLEERRNGHTTEIATQVAISTTATSTWTAALAAGLSYGSLMLTGFRGFKQFGIIGLIGMVVCWVSAYTVLPAFLVLFDRKTSLIRRSPRPPKPYLAGLIARAIQTYPKVLFTASLGLTLVSVLTFSRFTRDLLETDLSRLRNRDSITHGAAHHYKFVDEILRRDLGPVVILPLTRESTRKIAEILKEQAKLNAKGNLVESVKTLDDFLPKQQEEKIKILTQIRSLLSPRILKHLSTSDRHLVAQFLTPESQRPFTDQELPGLITELFREQDGSIGKLIVVDPKRSHGEMADGNNLIHFISTLRRAADQIEPGAPVAGSNAVVADMVSAISSDGPKATVFAFCAVVLLVIILFRNLRTIGLVLFALCLGVLWLAGIILGFQIKINFLNFIALPITFGIGVDYGVNIFQRYREDPNAEILQVIRSTGSAVGLCSFSTITGYVSLLIARNQGFVSFGALAVAGEITCVLAAMIALPAFIRLRTYKKTMNLSAH